MVFSVEQSKHCSISTCYLPIKEVLLFKCKIHIDCNDEHAEEEEEQLNSTITYFNLRHKAAEINLKLIMSAKIGLMRHLHYCQHPLWKSSLNWVVVD